MNSVSYALNLADFDALTKRVQKKRNGRVDWLVQWGLPVMSCALGLLWLIPLRGNAGGRGDSWLVLLWLGAGFYGPVFRMLTRRRFRKSPDFGSEAQVLLQEKGVQARGTHGESLSYWTTIQFVEESEAHIFLFLDDKRAFIVPKRAFSSPAEAENFAASARRFWQEAHPTPTAPPLAEP